MNYLKNHIIYMAILAFSVVFSAYGMQPQPDSKPTSLFKRYPLGIHIYASGNLTRPRVLKWPSIGPKTTALETTENTPKPTDQEKENKTNEKLQRKLVSALSRAAWLEHGDQIMVLLARYLPFIGRFF